jgi:hypothetical protein
MIFVKEELSFLNIYTKCADNKQPQNDKFQIKANKESQQVIFSQISDGAIVTTPIYKKVDSEFVGVYPIAQFVAIIASLPKEAEVDIQNDGIHFNGNHYEFEKFAYEAVFTDVEISIEDVIKNNSDSIEILDFGISKNSLMGLETDGVDAIKVTNGYFVSTLTLESITCAYKTKNKPEINFFIPKLIVSLCNEAKKEKVILKKIGSGNIQFHYTIIDHTTIIFTEKEYQTPDVFNADIVSIYETPSKIVINKNEFKEVLNRIKVFSSKNLYTRVKCSTTNNKFTIESKEPNSGYAVEHIDAEIDTDLQNQELAFAASQAYLSNVVSVLKGEKVVINTRPYSPDNPVMRITDEFNEDFFIVSFVSN